MKQEKTIHIGIVGGGPAGLFMLKHLTGLNNPDIAITIFEKKKSFGSGMPYSEEGACCEHVTNVSGNEIPDLSKEIKAWVQTADQNLLEQFNITPENFNDYKVLPRLFFGHYISSQFDCLYKNGLKTGLKIDLIDNTNITNVIYRDETKDVIVFDDKDTRWTFDIVIMCIGHTWPKKQESQIEGWYDSPYPPAKLSHPVNYQVAIRGASLTAIDAIKTLSYANGKFQKLEDSSVQYVLNKGSERFRIVLHSLHGLLPAIRFHLAEPRLKAESLNEEEMKMVMALNEGFVPLNYIFEKRFKEPLQETNPELFEIVKDMSVEEFVDHVMSLREKINAFDLFRGELVEAEKSIKRKQPVYWKELLAELSYALNYPAKHFSAEDMLRLKTSLMPLISIIIAFVPQGSAKELLALYDAGVLDLVAVDEKSDVYQAKDGKGIIYSTITAEGHKQEVCYRMFIDAIGQKPVAYSDFPFKGLKEAGIVSEAFLRFRNKSDGKQQFEKDNTLVQFQEPEAYYLRVPGININDHFQVLDKYNAANQSMYIMAVPYIAGLNPDYSGLDFCETAAGRIASAIHQRYEAK